LLVSLRATPEVSLPGGEKLEVLTNGAAAALPVDAALEIIDVDCDETGCEVGVHCWLLSWVDITCGQNELRDVAAHREYGAGFQRRPLT
jgi:hypothetical protein